MNLFNSVSSFSGNAKQTNSKKDQEVDFRIYIYSDIPSTEIDLDENVYEVCRWKESLFDGVNANVLDILTLGIPKLLTGCNVYHEFLLFKSKKYIITIDFIYTSSIVMRVAWAPSFCLAGRKVPSKKEGLENKKKIGISLKNLKKLAKTWIGREYHILKNNCQDFCNYLWELLDIAHEIEMVK